MRRWQSRRSGRCRRRRRRGGRKKEQRDHDIARIEASLTELVGEEREVVRVFFALHRGGDERADDGAEQCTDLGGDLVAQDGGGGRRAAVVDDDHGRSGDASGVDFLASIGIRPLLLSAKAVSSRGGKLVFLNHDANVTHILEMAGVDTLIPICRSLNEARSAIAA